MSDLIKKLLPKQLRTVAQEYDIDEAYLESETELVIMVLQSKSIDTTQEKQNRFNLLPLMNEEQLEKLRGILIKEKTKLKEIEDKYDKKKKEIKEKYTKKRDDDEYSEKVQKIKSQEKKIKEQDAEAADDLLDMI